MNLILRNSRFGENGAAKLGEGLSKLQNLNSFNLDIR